MTKCYIIDFSNAVQWPLFTGNAVIFKVSRRGEEKLDEDVQAEKDRINDQFATGEATDQLVIKNLTKVFF